MEKRISGVSVKTSQRWWLVALLTVLGIGVLASSIYFLIFPVGFQGGRNPYYGIEVIFNRESWDAIHLWTGLGMILIIGVHIVVHWMWIRTMFNRCFKRDACEIGKMNWRAQNSIILDAVVALSFFLASVSGIYLLFAPGRSSAVSTPMFIFSWYIWDVIHTWSGIVMFMSVILHFFIHWGWIIKVTKRIVVSKKTNTGRILEGVKNA